MRILFVAMANNTHTARWVNNLLTTGWDIHVFDMNEAGLTPELQEVTAYTFSRPAKKECNVKRLHTIWPFYRGEGFARRHLPQSLWRRLFPSRTDTMVKLIMRLQPDILHSLEMQHESYPLLEVRQKIGGGFRMPWIYSSWGSDLYHFGNQPEQRERISTVLSHCDFYIADCYRDVELARQLGFRGEVIGVFPGVGGFDTQTMRKFMSVGRPSARRVIALKGYDGWAGRALVGLRALQQCADLLQNYSVIVYMAVPEVRSAAQRFTRLTGIPVKVIPRVPYVELLKMIGQARIMIGLSISDGTPITMLESMVMGAFPIQSDTISTGEWISHGENGFLVPAEDPEAIAAAIHTALKDDSLVDRAAEINARLTAERIDSSIIKPQVIAMYEKVAAQAHLKKGNRHSLPE